MNKFLVSLFLLLIIIYTGPSHKIGWDDDQVGVEYELQIVREGTGETWNYGTPNKTMTITLPKTGKYEVRVRAKRIENSEATYSAWCSSVSVCAMLKDGTRGEWKAYRKPSAPIGPIIVTPR